MTKPIRPHTAMQRMQRWQDTIATLHAAITGEAPFSWRAVDMQHARPILEALGFTLASKTAITKRGWELKQNQKPIGKVYYTAPISRMVDVYLLETQARPK